MSSCACHLAMLACISTRPLRNASSAAVSMQAHADLALADEPVEEAPVCLAEGRGLAKDVAEEGAYDSGG